MASLSDIKRRTAFLRPKSVSWARVVSDVISPPVVWAIVGLMVGMRYTDSLAEGLFWAAEFGLLICLLPIVYVGFMVWRGKIGDIHMKQRKERFIPMLITVGCAFLALSLAIQLTAPPVFVLLTFIALVQTVLMLSITLFWQISMHMMSITAATVAVSTLFSSGLGLMLIPVIALVAAARLELKRHTPAQVLAGTLMGGLVPTVILLML
ncbi:hypothetical protein G4Y79_23835 [Phototrophicus methaneseepsis]|uniref:Uncharacterized protein n=1 Tax=Phototrophicus methaneseepsis TaxID=2710758 RepID=A0A7S8IF86_9CHLR|nr:hypothetical protein [Phototrophicus methaneseepsis]QPC82678.1 hypothetical protein G4Y79_23835 [Phototrophicus methaneseepsis]